MATLGLVSLRGLYVEAFQWTFLGAAGLTSADEGKAVALDTSAANTIKLAGAADRVLGILETVEARTQDGVITCTVAVKGGYKFPRKTGATVAVGDFIEGSSVAGSVQALTTSVSPSFQVVELISTTHVVAISV